MKKELLDKEVIVAYDIRQVQRFLFGGTSIYDYTGANDILANFFYSAFDYCVNHSSVKLSKDEYDFSDTDINSVAYFHNPKIKMQIITIGGGNAFAIYRSGRIAQKINRLFSSYLLHETYSLEVAIAVVEKTNDMEYDNNRLYLELDRSKNSGVIPFPLSSIAVCDTEGTTGFPTTNRGHQTFLNYSTVSKIKRNQSFVLDANTISTSPTSVIATSKDRLANFESVRKISPIIGYVHMDGNSMGMTIAKIKRGVKDYEEGVILSRKIQINIQLPIINAIKSTRDWLAKVLLDKHEKNPDVDAHIAFTHVGGDDINFYCDYHYAFAIVEYLANFLKNKYMWNDKRVGSIPFSVCAGIAFCSNKIDDFSGITLAEKCCSIAKKEAKKPANLINGRVGSWIYFQDCKYSQNFDFKESLEQNYVLSDGTNLCLRPYCFDKEYKNDIRHFSTFKKYCHILAKSHLSPRILDLLFILYAQSKFSIEFGVKELSKMYDKFPKELMTTFVKVPSRDKQAALWFDPLEIGDYFYDVYKE